MNESTFSSKKTARSIFWILSVGILIAGLIMAIAVFVVPPIVLSLFCDREADRKVLDAQTDFFCPDNNKIAYDAWGECGLKKECIDRENGKTDGSKFSAQNGQLQSKAMYEQGRQIGGWTGYDNEGNPLLEDGGYNPSRQQ